MPVKMISDYYIKRKKKMLTQFDKFLPIIKELFERKNIDYPAEEKFSEMKEEYENLIPEIPYIGGQKNSFTSLLVGSIPKLAIIRILEKIDLTYREIGEFVYELYEIIYKIKKNRFEKIGRSPAKQIFQDDHINYLKLMAEKSQKRDYPGDWVFTFIEGDGKTFDYGLNFTECGVHKIFKKLGAEKYVPFPCLSDFADANVSEFGFSRTQTLGNGDPICDHRYIKNTITQRAWPPDNIQEFKMDDQGKLK